MIILNFLRNLTDAILIFLFNITMNCCYGFYYFMSDETQEKLNESIDAELRKLNDYN